MPLAITHPKKRGEWVESQFLARAIALGLAISKPWGDSCRYDFIIDCGRGRLLRVQVKGTSRRRGDGYHCRIVSGCLANPNVHYSPDDVDLFALYLIPEDVWYTSPSPRSKASAAPSSSAPATPGTPISASKKPGTCSPLARKCGTAPPELRSACTAEAGRMPAQ